MLSVAKPTIMAAPSSLDFPPSALPFRSVFVNPGVTANTWALLLLSSMDIATVMALLAVLEAL
ncbi:hypothetical protein D3C73_1615770 [compost metagenome]